MLFKLAWRNIWRNKRRTLITMAAIICAVFLAVAMRSLQEGSYKQMVSETVGQVTGFIQVHQKGYWDDKSLDNSMKINEELFEKVSQSPHLTAMAPRIESFALASYGALTKGVMVIGVDPAREKSFTDVESKITSGSYLVDGEAGIVIAEGVAKKLKIGLGDTLVLISQGYHGASAAGIFPVRGLMHFVSPKMDRIVYMSLAAAGDFYDATGRATSLSIQLDKPASLKTSFDYLKSGIDSTSYEVMAWQEMIPELDQMIRSDRAGGILFMGILYLIIGFGMFGTVLMMIAERKYEFGVLIALGMKRIQIAIILFYETIMLSIMAVITGAILATPVVLYFQANPIQMNDEMQKAYAEFGVSAQLPMSFEFQILLMQALLVLIMSIVILIYPTWKIRHLKAVEAMRT